ncbi:amidohydrolase [Candidatus Enterococcus lemimoniae]|uniref:M20/M25/M40 family peptidase n=1 Tax=Candidatus Enterococcus lemimoniae TaxID=1834167 RepID=A0ABZ2T5R6_9ENTE|nr:amidohydrolase [Enterococcus sp. 12C11_DIV0727]OTO68023.1 M20/M25/M40 family peptidase [Enterococcus sp. 12C11_DIV0727]
MKELKTLVQKYKAEIIDFRRDLHQHPELQFEEFRTTEKVAEVLDQLEIPYRKTEPTGIIAELVGANPGKTVALRAYMDALPVQELTEDIPYKSLEDGKIHACGHDAHTAMLLTAAKALKEVQAQLKGTVRFIFQPSEENAQGAKAMVAQDAVDGVDDVFGIHVWSQMLSGTASCVVGSSFASADIFSIDFKGRGGHGAMPDACVDAAVMVSAFVMNVQSVVSRETNPLDPVVVTVGKMDVGTRFNVIAENARLEGTVRCFSLETRDRVEKALKRYAEQTALMYGGTATLEYNYGTVPVVNDEEDALFAQELIKENFGEAALIQKSPTTGGEDFSYFTEHTSGCFALVGCGNPEKDTQWAHHHGRFNVDEDAMEIGVELYGQYAFEYLNK